jgi:NAD(P)-dependent dehydrogenase (short-subunit alcohol dehydrogenase family)
VDLSRLVSLEGQIAIVTGAASGIGRGIATMLAGAGATVAVADVNGAAAETSAAAIVAEGGKAISLTLDVSSDANVVAGIDRVVGRFGRLDILVNNAGVYPFGRLKVRDDGTWNRIMDVNLKGPLYCMRAAAERMQRGGRIVNISSIGSLIVTVGGTHAYDASKAALNALTRAAADEWGPDGIRVNAVLPGGVVTEGTRETPDEILTPWIARTPARRMGVPADIAGAVLFLVTPLADYVHGHLLLVDGGFMVR